MGPISQQKQSDAPPDGSSPGQSSPPNPDGDELKGITSTFQVNEWMNKYYIASTAGGGFKVINLRLPNEVRYMTKKDFVDSLQNRKLTVTSNDGATPSSKQIPFTDIWLNGPRNEVERIIFDPNPATKRGFDAATRTFNEWRGFAIKPVRGDPRPFLRFWRGIISSGEHEHFWWYVAYVAQMLQQPHIKMGTSIVQRGGEGIGKSFFVETLGELISGKKGHRVNNYYFKASNPKHVTGKWNDHLVHCILLLLEETFYAGDIRGAHIIRDLTSGEETPSTQRYTSTKITTSYLRPFFNGNEEWLIHAASDSRRPFVIDVSSEYKNNRDNYFGKLADWLDKGGREALMYFLMHFDYTKYNLREAPITEALISQREETLKNEDAFWLDVLGTGRLAFYGKDREFDGSVRISKEMLFYKVCAFLKRTVNKNRSSETKFGHVIRKLVPNIKDGAIVDGSSITVVKVGPAGAQKPAFLIPPLQYCRSAMDIKLGKKRRWEEPFEWEKDESTLDKIIHGDL
jgi:hypothetical protein